MDNVKNKTRPIYSELQGMLSQAQTGDGFIYDQSKSLWDHYNNVVESLNKVTNGTDFERFKVVPQHFEGGGSGVPIPEYRAKLSGLISNLHGNYFYTEPAPFSGTPSTVVSQVQNQHQSAQVVMLLEIQDRISQQIPKFEEGTKERGFLEAIKSKLSTIKDAIEFAKLVATTAKAFGLDLDNIKDIL